MLGAALYHQGQAGDEGDQARPEEGGHVTSALEDHQGRHGHSHTDGEGNQEDADDETNDP